MTDGTELHQRSRRPSFGLGTSRVLCEATSRVSRPLDPHARSWSILHAVDTLMPIGEFSERSGAFAETSPKLRRCRSSRTGLLRQTGRLFGSSSVRKRRARVLCLDNRELG